MKNLAMRTMKKAKVMAAVIRCRRGEGSIGYAVSILIAVIIGALLLAGLYLLFGDVVMPKITEKITEMFNYTGA